MAQNRPPKTPETFRTALPANTEFEFVSAHTVLPYNEVGVSNWYYLQIVSLNGNELWRNIFIRRPAGIPNEGLDIGFKTLLKVGNYSIYYAYGTCDFLPSGWRYDKPTTYATYNISAVENKLPLKSFSVTDVINRVLDLAEPIRGTEKPKFRLNAEQAEKFDKITAPQFSMTKQTLRECLQEIGSFIHGEPRLTPKKVTDKEDRFVRAETFVNGIVSFETGNNPYNTESNYCAFIDEVEHEVVYGWSSTTNKPFLSLRDTDGIIMIDYNGTLDVYLKFSETRWIYEVSYDMWASTEKSGVYVLPYIKKTVSQLIDSYASYLDSNAENLVNQLDKYSGVIIEPYKGGAKTVRTDVSYVRIEENNIIIATQQPIYSVEKLEYLYASDGVLKSVDIKEYLSENSIYSTQLSSYTEQYPYSKAYGLFYTQGAPNIGGLNFKVDSAAFASFKEYAIVNILKQVLGSDYQVPPLPV